MNLWIVLCQATTFAFLLAQYKVFNEVDAEEPNSLAAGGWFGDLEKKLNVIKGVMHDVFQTIKRSALTLPHNGKVPHRRNLIQSQDIATTDTITEDTAFDKNNEDIPIGTYNENIPIGTYNEDVPIGTYNEDMYLSTKLENYQKKDIINMENAEEFASGISKENTATYHNDEGKSLHEHHKKKKKTKKNKKKIKPKRKVKPKKLHADRTHVDKAHVKDIDMAKLYSYKVKEAANEVDVLEKMHGKNEPLLTSMKEQISRKAKKGKSHRKKPSKFVKTTVDNKFNDSDSNESAKKGKPVDIIVHIKMNE